ncbi:MAG: hypothetical protein PUF16_05850 [Lachnospiraceae bacterium]|nr:hypothetical protein [Lachnospiraceae bacterium]
MNKDEEYKKPNTRPVPILITLTAAGISCVVSIMKQLSFADFVLRLLITVIIFGILGCLVRVFLDMGFKVDKKEEEKKASEAEDEEAGESEDDSEEKSEDEEQTQE